MKKKNKFINFLEAGKTAISSTFKDLVGLDQFSQINQAFIPSEREH